MTCDRVDPTGTSESMSRFSWSLLSDMQWKTFRTLDPAVSSCRKERVSHLRCSVS